ncbi:hypothetical protein QIY50_12660 [Pseudomonas putida]|nr:hypothetical protein QIY50_12660 [Pseudomonas putida]
MHDFQYFLICVLDWLASFFPRVLSKEAISALVGGGIAGWFGFKATKKAHEYALQKAESEEVKVTTQTLRLMLVEIQTAWKIYKEEYAPDLEALPDDAPHLLVFPLGENIFVVYDSAPSCMANLPSEVSETLVRIYMRMKGMVAMIKLNNEETLEAIRLGQEQVLKLTVSGKDPKDLEDTFIMHQARKMKMETNARSMRGLAAEIDSLYKRLLALSRAMGVDVEKSAF